MHHAHAAALLPLVLFVLFCYWAGQPSEKPASKSPDRES